MPPDIGNAREDERTLEERRRWSLSFVPVGAPIARRYSIVTRARLEGSQQEVAVKTCLDASTGRPSAAAAAAQFAALQRVHSGMSGARFTVARPMAVDEGRGALITEWIDGVPLTERLLEGEFSSARLATLCGQAGQWLRAFHDAHPLPRGMIDLESKVDAVRELLPGAAATGAVFARAIDTLLATAQETMSIDLPRSWVCGDFKADNLMVAGERMVGLDIDVRYENVVLHDLASFLNHLALDVLNPRRTVLWLSRQGMSEAFLAGYRYELSPASTRALAWVRLFQLLHLWRQMRGATAGRMRATALRLVFHHVCGPLMRMLERR